MVVTRVASDEQIDTVRRARVAVSGIQENGGEPPAAGKPWRIRCGGVAAFAG